MSNGKDLNPNGTWRGKERRRFLRYATDLRAQLIRAGLGEIECRVRDYSDGGMLVRLSGDALAAAARGNAGLRIGEGVRIRLQDPVVSNGSKLVFLGRVVRTDANRAGIAFINPDPRDLKLLRDHAQGRGKQQAEWAQVSRSPSTRDISDTSRLTSNVRTYVSP